MTGKGLGVLVVSMAALLFLAGCGSPTPGGPTGRLAFERTVDGNADIYAMNVDGSDLVRLTEDEGWDGMPSWSPDGSKIAFASERLGPPVIMVMNADGSDPQALTELTYNSIAPVWSPDGTRIAFASTRGYEVEMEGGRQQVEAGFEIWTMNPDGSDPVRITGDPNDQAVYPSWSPGSDQLAYMDIDDRVLISVSFATEDATISVVSEGLDGRHWTPAWSPDGDYIALSAEVAGDNDLWIIQPQGNDIIRLTEGSAGDGEPAWSPDGRHIAFVSNRDGPLSLYVLDLETREIRRLVADSYDYARPDWTSR